MSIGKKMGILRKHLSGELIKKNHYYNGPERLSFEIRAPSEGWRSKPVETRSGKA